MRPIAASRIPVVIAGFSVYNGKVTVFEASNASLKEFYLFVSDAPMGVLMREHCDRPPAAIAHWRKGEAVFYAEVEAFADENSAREFMTKYFSVLARTGWKILN